MTKNKKVSTTESPSKSIADSEPISTRINQSSSGTNTGTKQTASKPSLFLGLILFLLSGLALLLSWYALQKYRHLESITSQQLKTINTDLNTFNESLNGDKKPLEDTVKQLSNEQTQLKEHLKSIDQHVESALKQHTYQDQDWTLLKARYYLELAQINAHWGQEQQSTLMLLQQADNLLKTIPNQAVMEIRQTLAEEMKEVKALPQDENTEILKGLESMQTNLSELPLRRNTSVENGSKPDEESSSDLEGAFRNNLKQLSKLVVVRRSNNIVQTLIPMYQTLLIESVRMELQEAQWAVIQNNFVIYPLAITQAITLIKQAFDTDNEGTQAFINKLESFQKRLPVKNQLKIHKSLQQLNQFIETKFPEANRKTTTNPSTTGSEDLNSGDLNKETTNPDSANTPALNKTPGEFNKTPGSGKTHEKLPTSDVKSGGKTE